MLADRFELLTLEEAARVQEVVHKNNERWRRLRESYGPAVAAVATEREKLLLSRLDSIAPRALSRGLTELRAVGDEAAGDEFFAKYNSAMADCAWLWDLMVQRAREGTDNVSRSQHYLLPGELVTVVEETAADGKPRRLSKYGVMP